MTAPDIQARLVEGGRETCPNCDSDQVRKVMAGPLPINQCCDCGNEWARAKALQDGRDG